MLQDFATRHEQKMPWRKRCSPKPSFMFALREKYTYKSADKRHIEKISWLTEIICQEYPSIWFFVISFWNLFCCITVRAHYTTTNFLQITQKTFHTSGATGCFYTLRNEVRRGILDSPFLSVCLLTFHVCPVASRVQDGLFPYFGTNDQ